MAICVKILFYTVLFVGTDKNRFRDCGQCDTLVTLTNAALFPCEPSMIVKVFLLLPGHVSLILWA